MRAMHTMETLIFKKAGPQQTDTTPSQAVPISVVFTVERVDRNGLAQLVAAATRRSLLTAVHFIASLNKERCLRWDFVASASLHWRSPQNPYVQAFCLTGVVASTLGPAFR